MGELADRIEALLRETNLDLGMTPARLAEELGSDVDAVTAALDDLGRAGRAHPTSFGNWDSGPGLPPPDPSEVDQG